VNAPVGGHFPVGLWVLVVEAVGLGRIELSKYLERRLGSAALTKLLRG
jgi:hypothetical protein